MLISVYLSNKLSLALSEFNGQVLNLTFGIDYKMCLLPRYTVKPRPEAHMGMILPEVLLRNIHLIPQQTSQPSRFWRKIPAFSLLLRHYDFLPNYPAKLTFPLPYIHCSISPWYWYTQYDRNLQLCHSVCIALMYERCTRASAMHAIYAHTYTPRPQISTLSCVYS